MTNELNSSGQPVYARVAVIDVDNFSQRSAAMQVRVVHAMMLCLSRALTQIRDFTSYGQEDEHRIITTTFGDIAAVSFAGGDIQSIHLLCAEAFLMHAHDHNNQTAECKVFDEQGWCNCHDKFNAKIGLDEGLVVSYEDLNGKAAVAGTPLNRARTVAAEGNKNQVLLTESTYKQLIEAPYPAFSPNQFLPVPDVHLAEELAVDMYILRSQNKYISEELSPGILHRQKIRELLKRLAGKHVIAVDEDDNKISVAQAGEDLLKILSVFRPL